MQTAGEKSELWARYDVYAHVAIGRGAFMASRIVTLAPAFVLVNSADVPIQVCQHRSNVIITLNVGQSRPWPWFVSEGKTELLARPVSSNPAWCWSGRFSIAEVGNYNMRLVSARDTSEYTIFPIGITMQVSDSHICFFQQVCRAGSALAEAAFVLRVTSFHAISALAAVLAKPPAES